MTIFTFIKHSKLFKSILLVGCIFLLAIGGWIYKKNQPIAVVLKETTFGEAHIGGSFSFYDQEGNPRKDTDSLGKYMIVYFGYTYCPDICPFGLHNLTEALKILGPASDKIQPIFITIDPERDTQAELKRFAAQFHPRLLTLWGERKEIDMAIKAYGVYAQKVPTQDLNSKTYLMDHSSIMYIMDPEGKYNAHFTHSASPDEMAKSLKKALKL